MFEETVVSVGDNLTSVARIMEPEDIVLAKGMKVQIGCIIFGSLQWIGMFDIIIGDVINSLEAFMKLKESESRRTNVLLAYR
jgi:hypothetical protein